LQAKCKKHRYIRIGFVPQQNLVVSECKLCGKIAKTKRKKRYALKLCACGQFTANQRGKCDICALFDKQNI